MPLTRARIEEYLRYDAETGKFYALKQRGLRRAGAEAGTTRPDGYVHLTIDRGRYLAHRVAWFYVYGVWPERALDHIDCNPSNNRIDNLRLATNEQNSRNSRRRVNNTSGYKGVSFMRCRGKWQALIRTDSGRLHLGLFSSAEEGHRAYVAAARKFHGEFARLE